MLDNLRRFKIDRVAFYAFAQDASAITALSVVFQAKAR